MVVGSVNGRNEAVIQLRIRDARGNWVDVEAVIDTGFSGSLSLPIPTLHRLGLARVGQSSAFLADGSRHFFEIDAGYAELDGISRHLVVYAMGEEALLGMQFLQGQEPRIQVRSGGAVSIEPC